jgi:hypothetical protein
MDQDHLFRIRSSLIFDPAQLKQGSTRFLRGHEPCLKENQKEEWDDLFHDFRTYARVGRHTSYLASSFLHPSEVRIEFLAKDI